MMAVDIIGMALVFIICIYIAYWVGRNHEKQKIVQYLRAYWTGAGMHIPGSIVELVEDL